VQLALLCIFIPLSLRGGAAAQPCGGAACGAPRPLPPPPPARWLLAGTHLEICNE
jgi:hypothetical protein